MNALQSFGDEAAPAWVKSPCSDLKFRQWTDGRVEIQGRGFETCSRSNWRPAVDKWHKAIWAVSKKHGIPANWIAALMAIESSGVPNQQASKHYGLMMLGIPAASAAAKRIGIAIPTAEDLLGNNELNIELGAVYFKIQLETSKVNGLMPLAAVAYNAGGVYCGTGCATHDTETKKCTLKCPPNEWGVVGECSLNRAGEWVPGTYATAAVQFGNWAWEKGFGPGGDQLDWPPKPEPPQPNPPTPTPEAPLLLVATIQQHWGAALLGAVAGAALVYATQMYVLPALQTPQRGRARARV